MSGSNEQINCLLEGGVFENGVCRISEDSLNRREQVELKIAHMDDVEFNQLCFLVGKSAYKRIIAIRERMVVKKDGSSETNTGMGEELS